MKEIILGRDGNQPFKISEERVCVSSKHASITIDVLLLIIRLTISSMITPPYK